MEINQSYLLILDKQPSLFENKPHFFKVPLGYSHATLCWVIRAHILQAMQPCTASYVTLTYVNVGLTQKRPTIGRDINERAGTIIHWYIIKGVQMMGKRLVNGNIAHRQFVNVGNSINLDLYCNRGCRQLKPSDIELLQDQDLPWYQLMPQPALGTTPNAELNTIQQLGVDALPVSVDMMPYCPASMQGLVCQVGAYWTVLTLHIAKKKRSKACTFIIIGLINFILGINQTKMTCIINRIIIR